MKVKLILKLLSLCCAIALVFTGCGTVVTEESVWIEGEGNTQTITHSSGNKGSGEVDDSGRTDVDKVADNGSAPNLNGATVTIGYYLTGYCGEPQPSSPTTKN